MTLIIKSDMRSGPAVRRFSSPPPSASAVPPVDPQARERAAARHEIERLRRALVDAQTARETDVATAHQQGYDAGVSAAGTRQQDRINCLKTGLAAHRDVFDRHLEMLDGLAAHLAKTALGRVFNGSAAMSNLVADTLSRRIAILADRSVLSVRVSGLDFTDADVLDVIDGSLGGTMTVVVDPQLPAGACRLRCTLGNIDLDIPGQWASLMAMLDTMVEGA